MANAAHLRGEGEGAALAKLLDPVALEARLAEARARRTVALAARAGPAADGTAPTGKWLRRAAAFLTGITATAGGMLHAPRVRPVALLLLAGLAAAAAGIALAPHLRPAIAPEVALTIAFPEQPASIPSPPVPGAAAIWSETTPTRPKLAALVLSPLKLPPPRPVRQAAAALPAATSKVRAARVSPADAAPVLAQAAASAVLSVISRASAGGKLPFPVLRDDRAPPVRRATPRAVRDAEGLVRQLGKASREVVNGAARGDGAGIVRSIRRATAAMQGKPRSEGRAARRGPDKGSRRQTAPDNSDGHQATPARSGPGKQAERGGAKGQGGSNSKAKGADRNEAGSASRGEGKGESRGRDKGADRSESRGRDRGDDRGEGKGKGRDRDDDD